MTDSDLDATLIRLVEAGLAEDIGPGDRTSEWTIDAGRTVGARVLAKEAGVVAGLAPARLAFARVDPEVEFVAHVVDGQSVEAGTGIIRLSGRARSILAAERLALNFLQHLSGIATLTRAYVDAVAGTGARILDTRKTTPGLRALEKAAVLAGGGTNHRFGLYDMVLIKENHIRSAGGIESAVRSVRARNLERLRVEVEATTRAEVEEALGAGVDRILLDNMSPEALRESVRIVRESGLPTETEASGGVTLGTVRAIADTGVDFISIGAITHSARALDLSLLVDDG